jgi:D-alanine--poly(phosphoribitol) ligase subunit 1
MQTNVLEYLERGALCSSPDKIAIEDGERRFTFRQVATQAKRLGSALVRRGVGTHHPIAVFLPKSAEVVIANLGIAYSGNMYMNLDVKSPAGRIGNILRNVAPVLVVTDQSLLPALRSTGFDDERVVLVDELLSPDAAIDESALSERRSAVLDVDPLCIINTSGSTGTPKGVVLNHRGTIDFMDWAFERLSLRGDARIGSLSPFYFDIYTLELNYCLATGATMVLVPEQLAAFPAKLVEFISAQRISFIFWVPSIMVNISNQSLLERFDMSALTMIWFAGEVFPMKHLNRWRSAIPGATFVNLYGPIEASVDCTYFVLDREFGDDDPLPIGFPCRNTDVLVLNEENRPCAVGEHGELCVRGSSLAMGYWNDPEKTARAFVQNPLNSRYPEIIYRTGDVVYRTERGEIMFVGRKDFQIKHMGYRIELPEIEHQVLCLAGIANACVLYNRGRKEITLFYETDGAAVTPAQIRQHLSTVFPKYMWPTAFHHLDELPRNPNGKIDRNGLAEAFDAAPA